MIGLLKKAKGLRREARQSARVQDHAGDKAKKHLIFQRRNGARS